MIAIKNLLFQPLTFQLAGGGQGLHLNPRERKVISRENLSAEIETAAKRGLVSLTEEAKPPEDPPKAVESPKSKSKTEPKGDGTPTPRRRKRR